MVGTTQSGSGLDTVIGGPTIDANEALTRADACEADGNRIGAIEVLREAAGSGDERVLFKLAWSNRSI